MTTIRSRAIRATASLGAALVAASLAPVAAHADEASINADRTCYELEFCVYRDPDYDTTNSMYRFTYSMGTWQYAASEIFESDSSWWNRRGSAAKVYENALGFSELCLNPQQSLNYSWDYGDDGYGHDLWVNESSVRC